MSIWSELANKHELISSVPPAAVSDQLREKAGRGISMVHFPKAAGQSVIKWLEASYGENAVLNLGPFPDPDNPDFRYHYELNNWLTIMVVRNPFDTFTSMHFEDGTLLGKDGKESGVANLNWLMGKVIGKEVEYGDFDTFARAWMSEWPVNYQPWERPKEFAYAYGFDRMGNCMVDLFLRYEQLDAALQQLYDFREPIVEIVSSHDRSTPGKSQDYREHYTPELRALAEKHFASEMELFGYAFDGPTDDTPLMDGSQLVLPIA